MGWNFEASVRSGELHEPSAASVAARGLNTGSEAEPQSEAEVTLILFGRAGDIAEVGGSDITPRIREVRRVGEIIGLSPEIPA